MLGRALRARGHETGRVQFNVGDVLFWHGGRTFHYRGKGEAFGAYVDALIHRYGYTDLVMFGDTRTFHRAALDIARERNLLCHVFEEGYFRPHWITLERGGVNGHSSLSRDPAWYRTVAQHLPEPAEAVPLAVPMWALGAWEVVYHLPNVLNPVFYPGYKTHRPFISGVEFAGWAGRYARLPVWTRRDQAILDRLLSGDRPYYFFPLQLDGDSQILYHAPFETTRQAIAHVLASFARHAPSDSLLVVKNHPLDTGWFDYSGAVRHEAQALGVMDRVVFVETGDLSELLKHARGVITVNSTVGTAALAAGCPLIALGQAVYALPGLTHQDGLETFWREYAMPDAELFAAFRKVTMHATQLNGGYYSLRGCRIGVSHAVSSLESEHSLLETLLP